MRSFFEISEAILSLACHIAQNSTLSQFPMLNDRIYIFFSDSLALELQYLEKKTYHTLSCIIWNEDIGSIDRLYIYGYGTFTQFATIL